MNSTVGLWVAVLVLAIAAAYGNIQYFKQQTSMELNSQLLRTATASYLVDECGNENIKKLMVENAEVSKQLDIERARANDAEQGLRNTRISRDRERRNAENAVAKAAEAEDRRRTLEERLTKAEDESVKFREKAAGYDEYVGKRDEDANEITRLASAKNELESQNETLAQEREGLIRSARLRIRDLQTVNANLKDTIAQKNEAQRARGSAATSRSDAVGKILDIDLTNRFCVVDLGSVNNVRRGMRFEVGRWQFNQWHPTGIVELVKISPSTSEAIVIDEPTVYKVCPETGYVAKDIEEIFSPYAATRYGGAIKLDTVERNAISSMKESDPIIVGDSLRSRIYQRDRQLKFAFVGQPVVYAEEILRAKITEAGNIFQDAISPETDILIIGKVEDVVAPEKLGDNDKLNPEVEEAYRIAQQAKDAEEFAVHYGIPIMREVELNEFLRN
ncbi:MAG: hypothetical protein LBP75_00320 [Planctomycetota bacterium]|jgi:hypothetical protein|nr:hypothetical protein [Planctomycetota bacterium]